MLYTIFSWPINNKILLVLLPEANRPYKNKLLFVDFSNESSFYRITKATEW